MAAPPSAAPGRSQGKPMGRVSTPPGCRTPLSGERLALAAMEIADAEGLTAVSMRRIAAHLGVGTMTLYHHVRDKDELTGLMWDAFLAGHLLDEVPEDWRDGLTQIARRARRSFQERPWALRIGIRRGFGPNKLRHIEQCLTVASKITDDPQDQLRIIHSLNDLVVGCTLRELGDREDFDRRRPPAADSQDRPGVPMAGPVFSVQVLDAQVLNRAQTAEDAQTAEKEYPRLRALAALGCGYTVPRFEQALKWLLDGIAVAYAPEPPANR